MKRLQIFTIILVFSLVLLSLSLGAQECPFIPDKLAVYLNNEISGDRGFEYIRWQSHYHRPGGSKGFMDVAKLIENWSREFGLDNVHIAEQSYEGRTSWDVISGELWIVEPEEKKLGSYAEIAVSVPNDCPSAHETVELVYVGSGRSDDDFEGIDVAGKAVVTTSSPGAVMQTAVWVRGASGVISCYTGRPDGIHDYPDQVAYGRIPRRSSDGRPAGWAFMISPRKGTMVRRILEEAKRNNEKVMVKVDIETEFREPPKQAYTWAEITGSEIYNQDIVLTAHIQEEKASANDDASGCASLLEIGRTINRLVEEGRIDRPKRDIIFWWVTEHSSERQYFADHPEEVKNMLININQDMVGAKQSMGSRVQHIIRTPYSLPSYLNDVIESITEYVILTNTAFLAVGQAGNPQPFTKPILSHLGTRERYNAMVVPFFNNSDHDVFCEGIIGIPGVALINWPDYYIHSTGDDLGNVDQTQLKRNAFIVAATALFVANAGDSEVPLITSEVFSRGVQRIGKDLKTGLQHIRNNGGGTYEQSYKEAKNLVRQAVIRESKAVESVLIFAQPYGKNAAYVNKQADKIQKMELDLIKELDEMYFLVTGEYQVPAIELTPLEKEMAQKVPYNIDSIADYFRKRGRASVPGLHSLMRYETMNFVNGENSYLDIFNAVHAEAMSIGEYYYGTVTPEAVKRVLDYGVERGVLRLK